MRVRRSPREPQVALGVARRPQGGEFSDRLTDRYEVGLDVEDSVGAERDAIAHDDVRLVLGHFPDRVPGAVEEGPDCRELTDVVLVGRIGQRRAGTDAEVLGKTGKNLQLHAAAERIGGARGRSAVGVEGLQLQVGIVAVEDGEIGALTLEELTLDSELVVLYVLRGKLPAGRDGRFAREASALEALGEGSVGEYVIIELVVQHEPR